MIEISHKQARYLIREAEDRHLPDPQWTALQAHLENCPECRAYHARIGVLGCGLRRVLHQRWSTVSGPLAGLAGRLLAQRAARGARARRASYALLGLIFFAGVVALQWRAQVLAPAARPTSTAVLPTLTPTPVNRFQGLVAYESNQTGNSEVFLLHATGSTAPEVTNLTSSPAQDTDPAWSPDGNWLAFLSDRSGKRELYVVSVAGTRLTQLTADPDLDWEGPLSWSADGKWIALAGRRLAQDGDRWGYLVPLSGEPPVSLPGTRNMEGRMLFSPNLPLLATPGQIFNINDGWSFEGWYGLATGESHNAHPQAAPPQAAFDWALGAGSLAYLGAGVEASEYGPLFDQIRLSPVIGLNNRDSLTSETSQVIDRAVGALPFRSLSYMLGGPFLAALQDAKNTGCWTIHMVSAFHYNLLKPIDFTGLCVDSDLDRGSWSTRGPLPAGRWLAVSGRLADPKTGQPAGSPGIFSLRFPPWATGYSVSMDIERLIDLPDGARAVIPRVRPGGSSLNIQPQAARAPVNDLAQVLPPLSLTEGMLLAERDSRGTWNSISRLGPDGADIVMVPDNSNNNCPVYSPDGQTIAYQSYKMGRSENGIFAMDADGSSRRLALPPAMAVVGDLTPMYGCPVWAPEGAPSGEVMAVMRYAENRARLAVISPEKGVLGLFPIDSPSRLVQPVWSPDGKTIYLAETSARTSSAYLVSVSWSGLAGPFTLRVLSGWDDVHAMTAFLDGRMLALIAVQNAGENTRGRANLFLLDLPVPGSGMRVALPGYDPRSVKQPGRMVYLPDNRLLIAQPGQPLERQKTTFIAYDPRTSSLYTLAVSEDRVLDWAYRDGWLIYSSESGLWAQKLPEDLTGQQRTPPPVRLSDRVVPSFELKH